MCMSDDENDSATCYDVTANDTGQATADVLNAGAAMGAVGATGKTGICPKCFIFWMLVLVAAVAAIYYWRK